MKQNNHIVGLKTSSVDCKYSTDELIKLYSNLLNDVTTQQIKRLGVDYRYLKDKVISSRSYCIDVGLDVMKETHILPITINNLIVTSEIWEYQTPGIASTLIGPLGLAKNVNVYNLQGTACSSMPKTLSLCSHLDGYTLVIIDGITSPIYQRKLESMNYQIKPKTQDWVALMFGFLFGDGMAAFIVGPNGGAYKFNIISHVSNLKDDDWKQAAIFLNDPFIMFANKNILSTALKYTDHLITRNNIDFNQYDKIILHTGSQKIIEKYKEVYHLTNEQLVNSSKVLQQYGNLTGCSLPFVLKDATNLKYGLMIGISMGFSVDMVEIEKI